MDSGLRLRRPRNDEIYFWNGTLVFSGFVSVRCPLAAIALDSQTRGLFFGPIPVVLADGFEAPDGPLIRSGWTSGSTVRAATMPIAPASHRTHASRLFGHLLHGDIRLRLRPAVPARARGRGESAVLRPDRGTDRARDQHGVRGGRTGFLAVPSRPAAARVARAEPVAQFVAF